MLDTVLWLCSINTMYWLLARGAGVLVNLFDESLWEGVWNVLVTLYNMLLAILFSAMIFLAAVQSAWPSSLMGRQMCGFVMLYVALGAAYLDRSGDASDDSSWPGYVAGLGAYLFFAIVPDSLSRPQIAALYEPLKSLAEGWVSWLLTALMVIQIVWRILRRGLRGLFAVLGPSLHSIGIIKHPPIHIRRRFD